MYTRKQKCVMTLSRLQFWATSTSTCTIGDISVQTLNCKVLFWVPWKYSPLPPNPDKCHFSKVSQMLLLPIVGIQFSKFGMSVCTLKSHETFVSTSVASEPPVNYISCQYICVATWRKLAMTMWTYWSSSSRPEPMKHKCSPLAADPASMDCCCVANNALAAVANSDGACNICNNDGNYYTQNCKLIYMYRSKFFRSHMYLSRPSP